MEDTPGIKDEVVRRMLKNWKLSDEAESENRRRFLYAIKFRQGGKDQWDEAMLKVRNEGNRPTESYNQIPQFIHQVTNDQRMNMPQTRFVPGNDGSKEVAEIWEDYTRTIQTTSDAEVAYDAAVDNQVTGGWGYWRIITEYENEKTFDQVIKIKWVPNVFTIYDDPNSVEQDFSDRRYLIQTFDIPKDEFKDDYKGDDKDWSYKDFCSDIGDDYPEWYRENTVRIAEYWELTYTNTKIYRVNGKVTETKPDGDIDDEDVRDVQKPKVMWYKCTGAEVLEKREWPGIFIPYVRVSGEMLTIEGKTYYSGLVEGMIAPQKQYNYWSNTATEIMGLAPLAPWIMAVGQVQGLEKYWDLANVKKYPYLPYNPTNTDTGQALPPPQRSTASADISGALALVNQAQQNFYATTGIYPASLGQQSNEKSGKAIIARQREGDVSTFHFADNFARALRFQGRIFADLFPKIYDGSRAIRLTKEDKSTREVKINQKFKDEDGEMKEFDMTKGNYDVVVTTGPSFTTKRQESSDAMLQLAQSTNLMEVAPDLVFRNQDWPGADEIADRYKRSLPPQLTEDPKKDALPPQVMQAMEQSQQMIQQLQQVVQQQAQELESKQIENATKQADLQLKQQEMATKGQSEQFKAENDRIKLQLEAEKLELERHKLDLEEAKMKIDLYQNQINQEMQLNAPSNENVGEEPMMDDDIAGLQAKLQQAQERKAMHEQMEMQRQIDEQTQMERAEMKEQEERARSDALLANLEGIQTMLGGLMASIQAPKQVVRNPETGLIEGVING